LGFVLDRRLEFFRYLGKHGGRVNWTFCSGLDEARQHSKEAQSRAIALPGLLGAGLNDLRVQRFNKCVEGYAIPLAFDFQNCPGALGIAFEKRIGKLAVDASVGLNLNNRANERTDEAG